MKRVLVNSNIYNIIKDHIISKEELLSYINIIIKEKGLNKYINNVIFTKLDNNMGAYNSDTKELKINYDNICYYADYIYSSQPMKMKKNTFIGLYILMVLAHELTHVIQFYDNGSKFYELFRSESFYSASHYNTYIKYHDNFAFEREARINGIENVLAIIKENYDDNAYDYFYLLLEKNLKSGYSLFSSPNKKIKKLINSKININNLDLYDKLKYGFNITISELNKFNKNKENIIIGKLAIN